MSNTHPGTNQLIRVRYPHGGQVLVAPSNLENAKACGAIVIDEPRMEPTVNGAPEPRIHVIG